MTRQPYIIAEIASAHEGSPKILRKIVDQVIDIKPNAIKFQIFKTDQLLVKSHPMYNEFNKIFMNRSVWMSMLKKVQGKEKITTCKGNSIWYAGGNCANFGVE